MARLLAPALALLLTFSAGAATTEQTAVQVQDLGNAGLKLDVRLPSVERIAVDPTGIIDNIIYTSEGREVPVIRRWVAVPPGHRVEVEVKDRVSNLLFNNRDDGAYDRLQINFAQVQKLHLDPPEPVYAGGALFFRGVQIVPLTIYPVQYSEDEDGAIENLKLDICVNFVPDASVNSNIRPVRDPAGSEAARFLDNLLLNPPRRDPDELQWQCIGRIVILHTTNLLEAAVGYLETFADWKRRMGYQVDIEAIDPDLSPHGIRDIVRDEYYDVRWPEVPLSHLILVGHDDIADNNYFRTGGDHGDNFFALMDDDSVMSPDICVGRFDITSPTNLRVVVRRMILYEREPYLDNDHDDPLHWFSKAMITAEIIAQDQFAASMIQLGRWSRHRLMRKGFTQVDTTYATQGVNDRVILDTQEWLRDGRSLALSRGHLTGCIVDEEDWESVETDRRHPFVCAITCMSYEHQKHFFRSGTFHYPNGSIASLSMVGMTNTRTNQCVLGWIVRGLTYYDMNQPGWLQLFSKLQMVSDFRHDPTSLALVVETLGTYRLLGDPSVSLFTARPVELSAEFPDNITPGVTGLNVRIDSDGDDFPGAIVCLTQPENESLPQLVTIPGDDGWARFTFEPGTFDEGEILLTVTHPNTFPVVDTIEVGEGDVMIDLADAYFDDPDGLLGPGDTVSVSITFENSGGSDADDPMLHLSTEDEWITFSEELLDMDNIPSGEDTRVDFDLFINESSKPFRFVRIDARVTSGDEEWQHALPIMTSGAWLIHRRTTFGDDNRLDRGETFEMVPELANMGNLPSFPVVARLVCLNRRSIEVTEDEVQYPAIQHGQYATPNASFTVELDSTAIPGDTARFRLELTGLDGHEAFQDTIYFMHEIGQPNVGDPFGPDEYGYVCFDSGDEGWDKTPEFDWIELNPALADDAPGTRLPLEDSHEDLDTSAVVPLPFTFRYYGEDFDTLIICTNGWIAFGGVNSWYHLFRNWPIPGIQGPDAQVAVMWQDLKITYPLDERGVYHYYDENRGIYIVEWSKMQIFHGDGGEQGPDDHLVEIQVILYDPTEYPTSTGDGDIKMQYKTFEAFGGISWDNQFSTIGLKNLDNTGGLQYVYWNRYSPRCMPLADSTALYFSVDVETEFGSVEGRVVVADDEDHALEGVHVLTCRQRLETFTGQDGRFRIDDVAAGTEVICFSLEDYNTMEMEVQIEVDQTASVDVFMTYPLIRVSDEPIRGEARPDSGCGGPLITVHNDGIGPLDYSVSRIYRDSSEILYEQTWSHDISDAVGGTRQIYGCQFVDEYIYVSGTESHDPDDEYIWIFDREHNLRGRISQPSSTYNGFFDLAFDGEYLYGSEQRGDTVRVVVRFDLEGNPERVIQVPREVNNEYFLFPKALAWRPETETVFMANEYSSIYEMNLEGEIVDTFEVRLPGHETRIWGMAWNPVDDDDMPLYLMDWENDDNDPRRMRLIKVNPETRIVRIVGDVSPTETDKAKGLTIGFDWERMYTRMASIADAGTRLNDTLRVFEVGPDSRFLTVIDGEEMVPAGTQRNITILMSAVGFEHGDHFELGLRINHNARGVPIVVQILFDVDENSGVELEATKPLVFELEQAYPNPFNSVTNIGFSIDQAGLTSLSVYDVTGRLVHVLVNEELTAGRYQVPFRSDKLASGIYFYRLETGDRFRVKRMVLLR